MQFIKKKLKKIVCWRLRKDDGTKQQDNSIERSVWEKKWIHDIGVLCFYFIIILGCRL